LALFGESCGVCCGADEKGAFILGACTLIAELPDVDGDIIEFERGLLVPDLKLRDAVAVAILRSWSLDKWQMVGVDIKNTAWIGLLRTMQLDERLNAGHWWW